MRDVTTSAPEWLEAFAARLGVEAPSESERDAILKFAAVAAHASQRTAAPIACWIAAAAGRSIEDALAIAREVSPPPTN